MHPGAAGDFVSPDFSEILRACSEAESIFLKQGLSLTWIKQLNPIIHFNSSMNLQEKVFQGAPGKPGVFNFGIFSNFEGIELSANLQNSTGFEFDSLILDGTIPINNSIICGLNAKFGQEKSSSIITKLRSSLCSGQLQLTAYDRFTKVAADASAGMKLNNNLFLGLGVAQENQTSPIILKLASFFHYKNVSLSGAINHKLQSGILDYQLGSDIILAPNALMKLYRAKSSEMNVFSVGFSSNVKGTNVDINVSTVGVLTTKFNSMIAENIKMSFGSSVTIIPYLSFTPSIELEIFS